MLNISNNGLIILHFILTELAEIWTSLGLMVYIYIIELNFCGLSDKLKKYIMKTGEDEFKLLSSSISRESEKNNEDDDKNKNENLE